MNEFLIFTAFTFIIPVIASRALIVLVFDAIFSYQHVRQDLISVFAFPQILTDHSFNLK